MTRKELHGMRIVITGGKTGGHVFPALAVAASLGRRLSEPDSQGQPESPSTRADRVELLYVGFAGGIEERVVPAAGIPLMTVRLATPDSSVRTLVSLVDMMRAVFQCASRFRSFR